MVEPLLRIFAVFAAAYGLVALIRVRDKPDDWVPPRWEALWLGPVDRSHYQANALLSLMGGAALLAFLFFVHR